MLGERLARIPTLLHAVISPSDSQRRCSFHLLTPGRIFSLNISEKIGKKLKVWISCVNKVVFNTAAALKASFHRRRCDRADGGHFNQWRMNRTSGHDSCSYNKDSEIHHKTLLDIEQLDE